MIRCPVRGLIAPNKTRFALRPVIPILDCSPRNAQARRKTGKRRNTVSSSNSSAASAGICLNLRTIAPFFAPDAGLSLHKNSGDVCPVILSVSCGAVACPGCSCIGRDRSDDPRESLPSKPSSDSQAEVDSAATHARCGLRSPAWRSVGGHFEALHQALLLDVG